MSRTSWLRAGFVVALCVPFLVEPVAAQSGVVGWGLTTFDSHCVEESCSQVSAFRVSTLVLRSDGTLAAWGYNDKRQCVVPTAPSGLSFVEARMGGSFALARRSDGVLVGWGDNAFGQCTPPVPPPSVSYTGIAAGWGFGLGLRSDGNIAVWGALNSAPSLPAGSSYVELAAGWSHALAVRSDGAAVAWGENNWGQCNVPVLPPGLAYAAVSAGTTYSLGLSSNGMVVTWGTPPSGVSSVPVPPPGLVYTAIASGGQHALALRSDGVVIAWGNNTWHQCDVPVLPPGMRYIEIGAGSYHSLALRSDGRTICWGSNTSCQCNAPGLPAGLRYVECVTQNTEYEPSDYNASPGHFAALRSDGQIVTWGLSPSGSIPALPNGMRYEQLALGPQHAVALRSDGNVVAWGANFDGACNIPAPPTGLRYVEVRAGGCRGYEYCGIGQNTLSHEQSLMRLSDGSLVQRGTCEFSLCVVPENSSFTALAATGTMLAAVRADGGITRWGLTTSALPPPPTGTSYVELSLGSGTFFQTHCNEIETWTSALQVARRSDGAVIWNGPGSVPAAPPGLAYVEIAAGVGHALARFSDGSVVGWGDNSSGQCLAPAPRPGTAYVHIAANWRQSLALYDSVPARGSVAQVCAAGANSVSSVGASLEARGSASVSVNDLVLHVTELPPHAIGQFVYGSGLQYAPFGNGHLCIAGSLQRVLPLQLSSATGAVDFAVDLAQYPFSGSPNAIQPSSAWNFQYWYRDPTSSGASTFDTSGALHIVFAP